MSSGIVDLSWRVDREVNRGFQTTKFLLSSRIVKIVRCSKISKVCRLAKGVKGIYVQVTLFWILDFCWNVKFISNRHCWVDTRGRFVAFSRFVSFGFRWVGAVWSIRVVGAKPESHAVRELNAKSGVCSVASYAVVAKSRKSSRPCSSRGQWRW